MTKYVTKMWSEHAVSLEGILQLETTFKYSTQQPTVVNRHRYRPGILSPPPPCSASLSFLRRFQTYTASVCILILNAMCQEIPLNSE